MNCSKIMLTFSSGKQQSGFGETRENRNERSNGDPYLPLGIWPAVVLQKDCYDDDHAKRAKKPAENLHHPPLNEPSSDPVLDASSLGSFCRDGM
jgi:hypothetical protein